MRYERKIKITKSEAEQIGKHLHVEPTCADECLGEDIAIVNTAKFDNGFEVDVKCCGVQYDEESESNTAWTEAVLFHNGREVCCTEPSDKYLGKWILEHDGNEYVVIVEISESRVVLLVSKMEGVFESEYELISTDAPDSVINANMLYVKNCLENEEILENKYIVIEKMGYNVEILGTQELFTIGDLRSAIIDAAFHYDDVQEYTSFKRLNETILKAIHKVFDESVCDFSKWWQDDFETDYGFDTEEELKSFSESDLECVQFDWIAWVLDGFVSQTLYELGVNSDVKTNCQTVLIEEIHDTVKEELRKKINSEWQ